MPVNRQASRPLPAGLVVRCAISPSDLHEVRRIGCLDKSERGPCCRRSIKSCADAKCDGNSLGHVSKPVSDLILIGLVLDNGEEKEMGWCLLLMILHQDAANFVIHVFAADLSLARNLPRKRLERLRHSRSIVAKP